MKRYKLDVVEGRFLLDENGDWVDADIAQEMYDALVDLIGASEEISGEHVEGWLRLDLAADRARSLLEMVDK